MNLAALNVALALGWLLVFAGGLCYGPGPGLLLGGAVLLMLTLYLARQFGVYGARRDAGAAAARDDA